MKIGLNELKKLGNIWQWEKHRLTFVESHLILVYIYIYICQTIWSYRFVLDQVKVYEVEPRSWRGVLDTLCDKACQQWLGIGQWFSPGTTVSTTNKTERHDITHILLKVVLNTLSQPSNWKMCVHPYF
jgi:hypothetical protein